MRSRRFLGYVLFVLPLLNSFPALAGVDKIYTVGHSHIDLAWMWNYAEGMAVCRSTFGDVLHLMDEYDNGSSTGNPAFYSQSTAQAYEWMETQDPDLFKRIQYWVGKGQWEPVGGMWVESDTNLPSGESLVRQVLYGKLYFLEHIGVDVHVG